MKKVIAAIFFPLLQACSSNPAATQEKIDQLEVCESRAVLAEMVASFRDDGLGIDDSVNKIKERSSVDSDVFNDIHLDAEMAYVLKEITPAGVYSFVKSECELAYIEKNDNENAKSLISDVYDCDHKFRDSSKSIKECVAVRQSENYFSKGYPPVSGYFPGCPCFVSISKNDKGKYWLEYLEPIKRKSSVLVESDKELHDETLSADGTVVAYRSNLGNSEAVFVQSVRSGVFARINKPVSIDCALEFELGQLICRSKSKRELVLSRDEMKSFISK